MSCCFAGHINNLYNTTFWALVQRGGMSTQEAEKELMVCRIKTLSLLILEAFLVFHLASCASGD